MIIKFFAVLVAVLVVHVVLRRIYARPGDSSAEVRLTVRESALIALAVVTATAGG